MTASETKSAPAPSTTPPHTNPYLGIMGVFLGAGLATLNARLVGVGLADLRGAKGFGVDEASWIPTALNMATMFSGVFVVFVNAYRLVRVGSFFQRPQSLHVGFGDVAALIPGYWAMLALVVIAWTLVWNLLFPNDDVSRIDGSSQTADHLRNRGLCGGHCFHQQHRQFAGGMVHRTFSPGHGSSGPPPSQHL